MKGQPSDRPAKLLIVEDSPTMCRMYRLALGRGGAELLFAANGVEGLDLAAQEPGIDFYLVDINMPEMDGLEFLRKLRGELGVTGAPAVVVSTESEESDREAALEAGADAYLKKPWQPSELTQLIEKTWRESRS